MQEKKRNCDWWSHKIPRRNFIKGSAAALAMGTAWLEGGSFCYEKFLRTTGKKRKVPQQLYKAIF